MASRFFFLNRNARTDASIQRADCLSRTYSVHFGGRYIASASVPDFEVHGGLLFEEIGENAGCFYCNHSEKSTHKAGARVVWRVALTAFGVNPPTALSADVEG